MRRRFIWCAAVAVAVSTAVAACGTSAQADRKPAASGTRVIEVAASIDAWGSILQQLGGSHVHATSIITNPDTDPHDYEPAPADGRVIASARVFVENGIGYDAWAQKAVAANPDKGRIVVNVGHVLGIPAGGNPHRWYSPSDVNEVADAITAALEQADPQDAAYFVRQHRTFVTTALARYHRLVTSIRDRYAGTPVGASESIFAPMAAALKLDLITPTDFLRDISEGVDPSAKDKTTIDAQIAQKRIKVYVFNSQNSTPDITAQVRAAKDAGIPVTTVTETLSPEGTPFQDWQAGQLKALQRALQKATGQ